MGERTEQLKAIVLGSEDYRGGKRSGGMASWMRGNALSLVLGLMALVGAGYLIQYRVGQLETATASHNGNEKLHRTFEQVAQLTEITKNQETFKQGLDDTAERQKEIQSENAEEHKAIRAELKEVERELKAGQKEIVAEIRRSRSSEP